MKPTRNDLIEMIKDPWNGLVKPFLMDSPMSSNVIAGQVDIAASTIRALRCGINKSPNAKQLTSLTKFVIDQKGLK